MKNPISALIAQKIPFFIKNDYPRFSKLIEDFYKFLETNDNFLYIVETYSENTEINFENDPYIQAFLNELGWNLDRTIYVNPKFLIHTLRDFYLERGTPESFNYFFRIIFNSDAKIEYPRERMFQCSGASLLNNHWILTSGNNFSNSYLSLSYLNIELKGLTSKLSVIVNEIIPFYIDEIMYLKILIENTLLEFIPNEQIQISFGDKKIIETIYTNLDLIIKKTGYNYKIGDVINVSGATIPGEIIISATSLGVIDAVKVKSRGSGYVVGDRVKIIYDENNSGRGFTAKVGSVTSLGNVKQIEVSNSGYNYNKFPKLEIISETGNGAEIEAISTSIGGIKKVHFNKEFWKFDSLENTSYSINSSSGDGGELELFLKSCINRKEKIYDNETGFIGINSKLLDSRFYQNFSYTIEAEATKKQANDLVKSFLHPFGFQNFFIFSQNNKEVYEIKDLSVRMSTGMQPTNFSAGSINPTTFNFNLSKYFENSPDINLLRGINILDKIKFEDWFYFSISNFLSLKINDSQTFINQTSDPYINIV